MTDRQHGAERDQQIVEAVSILGYAYPSHVAALVCSGRGDVARRRLLSLTRRGLLGRLSMGRNDPYVYHLPSRRPTAAAVQHALAVADVYAALVATQVPGRTQIREWVAEWEAEGYRADALLLVTIGVTQAAVCLEVDLATERPAIVAQKVQALAAYRDSGVYRSATWWQTGLAMAQVVATPAKHVGTLHRWLSDEANRLGLIVGVAHLEVMRSEPWPVLAQVLGASVVPVASPAPQRSTSPQPAPAACAYTPAWQRRAPLTPAPAGGHPKVGDCPSGRPGGLLGSRAGGITGGAR